MKFTEETLANIYRALQTDPDKGLSTEKVNEIQAEKGRNVFEEEQKESILKKVLHHLRDVTSLILLAAAFLSLYLAIQEGHGYAEPVVIFSVVVIAIILAVRQELGAEKALEALKNMNAHMTVVIRDGMKQPIDGTQLVPGDILVLQAGDMIPADARVIECINLKVEESILTGESVPVEKDADAIVSETAQIGDRENMLFSGCLITNGRTKAVVVGTGMDTEMGKIAGLLNNTKKKKTPLQRRLDNLGKTLSYIAIGAGALLFLLEFINNEAFLKILMNAVALAVAVVPETLPVIVTITLAFGIHNMAKKHAIIRKIPAVETLGSTTVICSDKTGTLTMNQMSIKQVWAIGFEPKNAKEEFNHDERVMLEMMGLANNASIDTKNDEENIIGDPTETAILRLLKEKHIDKESLDAIYPKVFEIPFDSQRKLMTTVHELEDTRYLSITKGAFDRIPIDCKACCLDVAGKVHDQFAKNALRVLSVAYKYYDTLPEVLDADELEHGLTFAGLVGMIDPPRPESLVAVQAAKEAGIKTIMITGDHVETASAIAREIGIFSKKDKAVTGADLDQMSEEDLINHVKEYSVYARVSPEDKIRIVKAWQAHGEVVAMTGDGVNDAPALKAANVGVAMGSGSDVSKNAGDVILTDDNFSSIVDAVEEGRRVYDNIRKVLYSLLACNISEIFTMLLAIVFGWGAPLVAIQLLFINVIADGVPDMCICKEGSEEGLMKRKPVDKNAGIFADGLTTKIAIMATLFAAISLIGFYIGKFVTLPGDVAPSHEVGQTMAFMIIGWSSVVNIFNVRSNTKSIFSLGFTSNRILFFCICLSLGLIALLASVPVLATIFHLVPASLNHWLIAIGFSITPLFVAEVQKWFYRAKENKK